MRPDQQQKKRKRGGRRPRILGEEIENAEAENVDEVEKEESVADEEMLSRVTREIDVELVENVEKLEEDEVTNDATDEDEDEEITSVSYVAS